jgi:hypothetical protein
MDLIGIYKAFKSITKEYTFFPSAHYSFFSIDHILCQKRSLIKLKKIKTILSILSDNKKSSTKTNVLKEIKQRTKTKSR